MSTLLENNEALENQRKLVGDVKKNDRLRDENLSKQRALRESIQDKLQEFEDEFSSLTRQRMLKAGAGPETASAVRRWVQSWIYRSTPTIQNVL
jgi:hypothetical protein